MSSTGYRGMDAEALTDAYSPSRTVPGGVEPWIKRYRSDSDAVKSQYAHHTYQYAEAATQNLDFFPATDQCAPLHVFVHGGYWQQLSKDDSAAMAPVFLEKGCHFATLNYTLAPEASVAEIVEEVRTALVWLWQHAPELGVSREQIRLSGHSAGGHLCAMMLCQAWEDFGLPANPFEHITLISGVFELKPLCDTYINDALGLDVAAAKNISPQLLPIRSRSRVQLVVGALESEEFQRQSRDFAEVLRGAGLAASAHAIAKRHHFDIILNYSEFPPCDSGESY